MTPPPQTRRQQKPVLAEPVVPEAVPAPYIQGTVRRAWSFVLMEFRVWDIYALNYQTLIFV